MRPADCWAYIFWLPARSWLVEVVAGFRLQQETLFLAVSYLDRFLSTAQVSDLSWISSARPHQSAAVWIACLQ